MKIYTKWVKAHCGTLENKTIVVTGGDGSIGYYICYYALFLGAKVIIASLDTNKCEIVKKDLLKVFPKASIEVKYIDLNKLDMIKPFVDTIAQYKPYILVNNAGVYHLPKQQNEYNIERTFAINYIGTSLLTQYMLPILKKNGGKVVYQSSISVKWFKKFELDDVFSNKEPKLTRCYGKSKKEVLMDALRLKREGYVIDFAHPGASATGLFDFKRGGFTKAFNKLIVPLMKLVFNSPSKASLGVVYALTHDLQYDEWAGPVHLFNFIGYPKVCKIPKACLDEKVQNELLIKTNSLLPNEFKLK